MGLQIMTVLDRSEPRSFKNEANQDCRSYLLSHLIFINILHILNIILINIEIVYSLKTDFVIFNFLNSDLLKI